MALYLNKTLIASQLSSGRSSQMKLADALCLSDLVGRGKKALLTT